MYTLFKWNANGASWHIMRDDGRIVFAGRTKRVCLAYFRRHAITEWEQVT